MLRRCTAHHLHGQALSLSASCCFKDDPASLNYQRNKPPVGTWQHPTAIPSPPQLSTPFITVFHLRRASLPFHQQEQLAAAAAAAAEVERLRVQHEEALQRKGRLEADSAALRTDLDRMAAEAAGAREELERMRKAAEIWASDSSAAQVGCGPLIALLWLSLFVVDITSAAVDVTTARRDGFGRYVGSAPSLRAGAASQSESCRWTEPCPS